mgnify:FL=1
MTTKTEKKVEEKEVKVEEKFKPSEYGCEILLEKTTLVKAQDRKFPTDAHLVWYNLDGEEHLDLTRCSKRTDLFDMYYDRYGPNVVKRFDHGRGTIKPNLWGYRQPDKKATRKRKRP